MNQTMKQWMSNGIGKMTVAGLAAALLFGTAPAASAMVWSEGRPLIQTRDVAGSGVFDELDGPTDEAEFRHPAALLVLGDGSSILAADSGNHRIRLIRNGNVSVYAGTPVSVIFDEAGLPAGALSDGPAESSLFWNPTGLAADRHGNVYVADAANHAIRKISPSGEVATVAGSGVLGHLDGAGSEALFHYPMDVAVDAEGNVYVADTLNHAIRKITPQGEVTTLNALSTRAVEAYDGVVVPAGGFADGPLAKALFNEPSGLALDSGGQSVRQRHGQPAHPLYRFRIGNGHDRRRRRGFGGERAVRGRRVRGRTRRRSAIQQPERHRRRSGRRRLYRRQPEPRHPLFERRARHDRRRQRRQGIRQPGRLRREGASRLSGGRRRSSER